MWFVYIYVICGSLWHTIKIIKFYSVITGKGESCLKADPKYVSEVYDEMAKTFDEKLVGHLGYKVKNRIFLKMGFKLLFL